MVVEAVDEGGNGFIVVDVGDRNPCLREATDVVTQWLIGIVSDFLQIIFITRLFTRRHVVFDEHTPELSLGVDGVILQAEEPLIC
jgi:hypothetical protein